MKCVSQERCICTVCLVASFNPLNRHVPDLRRNLPIAGSLSKCNAFVTIQGGGSDFASNVRPEQCSQLLSNKRW